MKNVIALTIIILLPLVAGCGSTVGTVNDIRAQACTSMKGLSQNVTDVSNAVKDSSTKLTVGDLKTKLKPVRDILNTVKPVASAAGADQVVTALSTALDNVDKALEGATDGASLSTVADKLTAPVDEVQKSFDGALTRLCPS